MRKQNRVKVIMRGQRAGRRRTLDLSAVLDLVLALPLVFSSLFVVALLGQALLPQAVWVLPVGWLLSGAVVFLPQVDVLIAATLRARRPTGAERAWFMPLWHDVCANARVDGRRYSLWVRNSDEVNALATGGHVVAVTTAALDLPARQLEAVLAHELGHHLSGHATASLLRWWYGLPARLLALLVGVVSRLVLAIGQVFGSGFAALVSLVVVFALFLALLAVSPWLLLLPVLAPVLAWTSRRAELRADRIAAELGYAPPLLEVLRRWLRDEPGTRAGVRARMLASHPSCATRIRGLENYLSRGRLR
jgi:Zn-dependent protease with chaperone function